EGFVQVRAFFQRCCQFFYGGWYSITQHRNNIIEGITAINANPRRVKFAVVIIAVILKGEFGISWHRDSIRVYSAVFRLNTCWHRTAGNTVWQVKERIPEADQ